MTSSPVLQLPTRQINLSRPPLIMGIVNLNGDSFSNDGTIDPNESIRYAIHLISQGADIIDLGAESARTNRQAIPIKEEIQRIDSFLKLWPQALKKAVPKNLQQVWPPILSVNTWRPEVVQATLPKGVEILDDLSGLPDETNAQLCAEVHAALLIMHTVGEPKKSHLEQVWNNVVEDVCNFFLEKIALANRVGLQDSQIILDPGIDFAKQRADNLLLYRNLERLTSLGPPLLLPVSRKTIIGEVLDLPLNPIDRDGGTLACLARGVQAGAKIFRVHNVRAAWQAIHLLTPFQKHKKE